MNELNCVQEDGCKSGCCSTIDEWGECNILKAMNGVRNMLGLYEIHPCQHYYATLPGNAVCRADFENGDECINSELVDGCNLRDDVNRYEAFQEAERGN